MTRLHRTAGTRGVTLLEAMISLSLLLVGLLALMRLQIVGITSNQGARANGEAQELARELAAALDRLDPSQDAVLAPHATTDAPPTGFGNPVDGSGNLVTTGWRDWDDAFLTNTTPAIPSLKVVGVTPDTSLQRDPRDSAMPVYRRRWSVWQAQSANQQSGVRLVAVSVVYRERTLTQARVVTRYLQVPNLGASTVNASAYR